MERPATEVLSVWWRWGRHQIRGTDLEDVLVKPLTNTRLKRSETDSVTCLASQQPWVTPASCFCICISHLFRPKRCSFRCGEHQHGDRSHLAGAVTETAHPPPPRPVQNQFAPANWSWQQFPFSLCWSQPPPDRSACSSRVTKQDGWWSKAPKKSGRELFFKLLVQIPPGSAVGLKLDQVSSRQLRELQEKITSFKSFENEVSANRENFCLLSPVHSRAKWEQFQANQLVTSVMKLWQCLQNK